MVKKRQGASLIQQRFSPTSFAACLQFSSYRRHISEASPFSSEGRFENFCADWQTRTTLMILAYALVQPRGFLSHLEFYVSCASHWARGCVVYSFYIFSTQKRGLWFSLEEKKKNKMGKSPYVTFYSVLPCTVHDSWWSDIRKYSFMYFCFHFGRHVSGDMDARFLNWF